MSTPPVSKSVPNPSRPNPFKPKATKTPVVVVTLPVRSQPWRTLDRNVMMLTVDRNTDHIAARKYDGKSAAICLAALAYSHVYPLDQWNHKDVNKILDIGQYLHKTTCLRNKSDRKTVRPGDIISSFYIDFTKITTLVGSGRIRGDFNPTSIGSDDHLMANIHSILSDSIGCILCYDRNKYVSIWLFGGNFYVFYVYDQDNKLVRRPVRESCCLRLHTSHTLVQFLPKLLKPTVSKYIVMSVKILSVQELSKYPEENPLTEVERQWSDKSVAELRVGPTMVQDITIGGGGGGDEDDSADTVPFTLPEQFGVAPYLDNFQQAFVPINTGRDILRGFNYTEQNYRVPCMNVAAITMLRITRSFTWTWDTLEEILNLGHEIYDHNRSLVDSPDILATDIVKPVTLGRSSYEIVCEQAVFGELLSVKEDVPHLDRALQVFFKIYDTGVLQGPQSVAVWHELGHYYMFDAKERDKYGRKWTQSMANEFSSENTETVGCCCVTRFRDLEQLVNVYTETVPLKHRRDPFRITRIDVQDFQKRSDNWVEWVGIGIGKWILRGKFYQGNVRFEEDGRGHQATCIAAMALVYSILENLESWNSALIDEILEKGDELHKQSVEELKVKERFVSQMLCASEVSRSLMVKEQQVELSIDDCMINGSLQSRGLGPIIGLEAAFSNFFTSNTHCILTASEISIAVWKNQDFYYIFDSHARDENGRNPETCRHIAKSGKLGTSCAIRFASLSELTTFVIKNMDQKTTSGFNISRLDVIIQNPDEAPPLKKYKTYLDTPDTAIVRPSRGIHEGNKFLFDLRADKQTLCSLLVAICMSRLNHSDNWGKNEILDILNAADKMFVSITVDQAQSVQDDFTLIWDNVIKAGIDIGKNKFSIANVERKTGVLVAPPAPEVQAPEENNIKGDSTATVEQISGEEVRKKRVTVVQPETAKKAQRSGSKLSRLSMDINAPKIDDEVSQKAETSSKIEEEYVAPDDLKSLLQDWSLKEECEAVLESLLFTVGLWKQDKKYYLFDPKACDSETAGLTEKRVKIYEKLIKIRNEEAEAARLLAEQQKQEEDIEGEELIATTDSLEKPVENSHEKVTTDRTSRNSQLKELLPITEEEAHSSADAPTEIETKETEPEDLVEEKEASSVVLRFTTLDNLIDYIIKLVPEHHHNQEITVVQPQISCRPIDLTLEKYFKFKRIQSQIGDPFWIIRASMSQNDQIFQAPTNRNRQDAANSITALSMATFCCAEDWTPVILDVILKYGDRLHAKSLQQFKPAIATDKHNLYQIVSPFVLASVKFSFSIEFYSSGDMLAEPGNTNIRSVFDVLTEFFGGGKSEKYGVLVTKQYFVSVWRDDCSYYLFDPHEIGPDGKRCTLGVASLFRFTDMSSMAEVVLANLNETSSDFTSFQLYKVTIRKSKMPKTSGICGADYSTPGSKDYRMVEPKTNSAYSGCQVMRLLHGNMSETCPSLKYHTNPPTACHAVAAMAMSREMNSEFWTPRVLDQILLLGNELFDLTLDFLDDNNTEFDTSTDRLRPQQVRKNFLLRGGKILVHMEMDLFQKGIVTPKESCELSLKSAISRFFASHNYAVVMTDRLLVSVWVECGFFYLYYAQPVNQNGLITKSDNSCVARFTTFMHLYQALLMNLHDADSSSWFEIRRCDFTLKKVPKGTVVTRTNSTTKTTPSEQVMKSKKLARSAKSELLSTVDVTEKPKRPSKKKCCSGYLYIDRQNCMLLRSSPLLKSYLHYQLLRECQSAAIAVMAVAVSCVDLISGWTTKTMDIIVRSGLEIYRDACSIHNGSFIRLHEIPRKIVIGDVLLNLSILSPIITDSELDEETLFEFFEQHTMAYVVLNRTNCLAIVRLLNQFYLFDPMPRGLVSQWGNACSSSRKGSDQWACVLRFLNLQGLYDFLLTHYVANARAEESEFKFMLGPIKCVRGHPAHGNIADADEQRK